MKLSLLGKQSKGTIDFALKSEDQFGYTVQCEDNEGIVIFNNVQSIRWIAEGRIVYLDPYPVKNKDQYNFSKSNVVKIRKAKHLAEESFEHHYFR